MTVINDVNWRCFLDCVGDLLFTPEVQSMRNIPHHPGTTCYEHSVFVAYAAFRMARRWNLDYMAAARCGLLHDLYLYDPRDKSAHPGGGQPGRQGLRHRRGAGLLAPLPGAGKGHGLTAEETEEKGNPLPVPFFLPCFDEKRENCPRNGWQNGRGRGI